MLHFTNHAEDRMKERRLSKREVKECIQNYDQSLPDPTNEDNMKFEKTFPDGKRVRVIVNVKNPKHMLVVSAMPLDD